MRLARSTLYNLIGLGAPLGVAVFTIPALIGQLGDTRFGLLTLIWAVVSYFGLFDLGLGRALTQQLAARLAKGENELGWRMTVTASYLLLALGLLAGALMALSSPLAHVLVKQPELRHEVSNALLALALCMPAVTLTSGFRGVLEAKHQFGLINLIRVPMGIFTFVGPWAAALLFGPDLGIIAWVLCLGRVLACLLHAFYAFTAFEGVRRELGMDRTLVKPLCVTGGWMTVSNIVSPLMGYSDRFVVTALISAAALTYYVTPHELVTKLWIIPGALTATLFPVFASHTGSVAQQSRLVGRSMHLLVVAMALPTLAIACFAQELLTLWVSAEFAARSSLLTQIFCLGVFVNSLAHIPYTLLQGRGAARLTATIHLVEVLPFLALLATLTHFMGLTGAAIAWLIRLLLDTSALFYFCKKELDMALSAFLAPPAATVVALELIGFATLLGAPIIPRPYLFAALAFGVAATLLAFAKPARLPRQAS